MKILRIVKDIFKRIYKLLFKKKYVLISDINLLNKVIEIESEHYENVYLPEVYDFRKSGSINVKMTEISCYQIGNATVEVGSDVIIAEQEAIWTKYYSDLFSKSDPIDQDVVRYDNKNIWVIKPQKKVYLDNCITLLAQFDTLWTHFIMQGFAKLCYLEQYGLLDKDIQVLVPKDADPHIKEAVNMILSKHENASIFYCESKVSYVCKNLYFIPNVSQYTNNAKYVISEDSVFPYKTVEISRKRLFDFVAKNEKESDYPTKIYLPRRGTYRAMINWKQVEDYFVGKGFTVVEPHKLSLEEKIRYFRHANVIIGPFSGAFTNILFCENAKILEFSNISRTAEVAQMSLLLGTDSKLMLVTDKDMDNYSPHSAFFVDLEKIKKAYNDLMEIEK